MFGNNISVNELKKILDNGLSEGSVVVDIREDYEFESGHIKGAINMPLSEIGGQIGELQKYSKIYMYCRSGGRSGMAVMQLAGFGLPVENVQGGTLAWQSQGFELVR